MVKKSKKPRDTNSLAAAIVAQPTDPEDQGDDTVASKDPAAVKLGRKGGVVGGRVRADRMTREQRSEAARKAVQARWSRES